MSSEKKKKKALNFVSIYGAAFFTSGYSHFFVASN